MNPDKAVVQYYLRQAGRGSGNGIGPIYTAPPIEKRGQGIGSFLGGLFRFVRPVLWSGTKALGKQALRETLRTGGKILTNIAESKSPDVTTRDIISKHVTDSINRLSGIGRKRSRPSSTRNKKKQKTGPPPKKLKRTEPDFFS